jgi:hypothetical protein
MGTNNPNQMRYPMGAGAGEPSSMPELNLDVRTTRVCCGKTIEPRLAEIRDDSGSLLFVTVWHCPSCRKVTH